MLPIGCCLVSFGTSYAELRTAARQLDQLGYDSVWLWDHYLSWNDPYESVLEGWTTLAALAEATERLRLGPLVANITNRHPSRLAKVVATLQEISGGRAELGLGAGGWAGEQRPFGIEQGSAGERVGCVAEALQIIPALWQGRPVTFAGRYYQLAGAVVAPAPQPTPRLIVGASGPRMVRLAGRYAAGVNLQWRDRDRLPELLAAFDAGLAESGRDRSVVDVSIHPGWDELMSDPKERLNTWRQMGFTRVIPYVAPPFPLAQFEELAGWLQS